MNEFVQTGLEVWLTVVVVSWIITIYVFYWLMKTAVKNAIRETKEEVKNVVIQALQQSVIEVRIKQ